MSSIHMSVSATMFTGLRGLQLKPAIYTEASDSRIRLLTRRTCTSTLTVLCCNVLRNVLPNEVDVLDALAHVIPPGLRQQLKRYDWLLKAVDSDMNNELSDDEDEHFRRINDYDW